jgi:hypothetical protein
MQRTLCVLKTACVASFVATAAVVPATALGADSTTIPLTERVLQTGEFQGFPATSPPKTYLTPAAFAQRVGTPAIIPKLKKAGFVRAVYVTLGGPRDHLAFSYVIQYRTPQAAKSEALRIYREDAQGGKSVRTLPVSGIPGAKALTVQYKKTLAGVYFADGPFAYQTGLYSTDAGSPQRTAAILAASKKLYDRVQGKAAPTS